MKVQFRFITESAVFECFTSIATQTSRYLRGHCRARLKMYHMTYKASPYILDSIVESGHTLSLKITKRKELKWHLEPLTDPDYVNVTDDKSTLDVLMDILEVAYHLGDETLINAAHAMMRFRVTSGGIKTSDWIQAIVQAYTPKCILLTAGIEHHRTALESQWELKDVFQKALSECKELQDD
ncbi:hypothetical protein BU25DRAFT_424130 [Macroventuria anomochaeta]|uniref:Uncharacterized protein n=1 Tax=Macroventuria anomochaeta TaxID=301207 RepID=A0ACB6RRH7_9PLEO|nr:uncharacterized protein BU25DRAFT_424130 [Macroventuria anomochaeta]KAF2624343.1 hypothetical protein BU25DRAFT_424130 [Macroventuria anomochaeta]